MQSQLHYRTAIILIPATPYSFFSCSYKVAIRGYNLQQFALKRVTLPTCVLSSPRKKATPTVVDRPLALVTCTSFHPVRKPSSSFCRLMAAKSLKLMFLGAPGAGKGTYASRLAPLLQIPTISTGDLVRHEIQTGTALGETIKAFNHSGQLVPDAIILDMMEQRLGQADAHRGFILDGFPRNVSQAKAFQQVTTLDLVLNIELPQWILKEKISGRRSVVGVCYVVGGVCYVVGGVML